MIQCGDVYRIPMNKSDGISPKGNAVDRNKYIIIIGEEDGGDYFGVVVTNTKDHHLIPMEFQYPITMDNYQCFANCFKLYEIHKSRLQKKYHQGRILNDDLELIIGCIRTSPRISAKQLEKYGIR
jgi:hypothetical protein